MTYNLNTLSTSQITVIFEFLLITWSVAPFLMALVIAGRIVDFFLLFSFYPKTCFNFIVAAELFQTL